MKFLMDQYLWKKSAFCPKDWKIRKLVLVTHCPTRLLSLTVEVLPSYFQKLFNEIICRGYFPSVWPKGVIVPIHKSGSHIDPNNYRGICISSCLGKVSP